MTEHVPPVDPSDASVWMPEIVLGDCIAELLGAVPVPFAATVERVHLSRFDPATAKDSEDLTVEVQPFANDAEAAVGTRQHQIDVAVHVYRYVQTKGSPAVAPLARYFDRIRRTLFQTLLELSDSTSAECQGITTATLPHDESLDAGTFYAAATFVYQVTEATDYAVWHKHGDTPQPIAAWPGA